MYRMSQVFSLLRTLFASSHVPPYTYKPLNGPSDAIRLILLQPAPFISSPISCRMIETTWGHQRQFSARDHGKEEYTALSYTWGSSTQKSQIEVDGQPFHVTSNLHTALQYLRSERKEVRIWADSLCINQDDVEERNLHVSQMREIYAAAEETTIFLGEGTPGSNALFSAIRDASEVIIAAPTRNAVVKSLVKASGMSRSELADEASKILWRSYWKRIWIFQEIVVSENPWVQCGISKVPWEEFCQAVIALLMEAKFFGGGYGNEAKGRLEDVYWERRAWRAARGTMQKGPAWDRRGQETEDRMGLLDLLVTKRGSEASDDRDMVFAVSGCATPKAGLKPLGITYEKSAAMVYMDTVKYLLQNDGSYDVLSHAGDFQSTSSSPRLPSWVPDWRRRSPYKNKIVEWIPASTATRTTVQQNCTYLENHSVLLCNGYIFDEITSISADTSDIKPAEGSIGRVIWDDKWRFRRLIKQGMLWESGSQLGTVTSLISRSHAIVFGRKLARLRRGSLALVPSEASEGDLVSVFTGSGVPFILRQMEKAEDGDWDEIDNAAMRSLREKDHKKGQIEIGHYRFIGECFVDGLMGGEVEIENQENVAFVLH